MALCYSLLGKKKGGGGTQRKRKNISVASLDLDAMVAGNAGGGWTCYESALSPDPAQAKLQAEDFWRCKRSSSKFREGRGVTTSWSSISL
jgi:hypothetical protein